MCICVYVRYFSFVLFYSGLPDVVICIDAAASDNQARYIRYSCTPNTKVFHIYCPLSTSLLFSSFLFLWQCHTCSCSDCSWQHCSYQRHKGITRAWLRYVRFFAIAHPSVVCLSVTLVHPTQGVETFRNILSPFYTLATLWPLCKILRRCPKETPPWYSLL